MGWISKNIKLLPKEEILFDTDDIRQDSEGNYLIDIAYRRVSTEKQAIDGFGLDSQLEILKDTCRENNSTACILITDDGETGTKMDRPGMACFVQRLSDFNNGNSKIRVRKFFVPRMDRLGRNLMAMLQFIDDYILPKSATKSEINENRFPIEFVSAEESSIRIVTTPDGELEPTSQLLIVLFSCLADIDRKNILRKFRDGKASRVASGYPLGGGRTPYGYKYVENTREKKGNYETIPEQKEKFLEARRLFIDEHMPIGKIAELLNIKNERVVEQMLRRRTYLNLLSYKGKEYPGHFEAFITEDQWQEQQDEFESRKRAKTDTKYMLTGLVVCGNCKAKLRYQKESATGKVKLVCYSQERSKSKSHLVKDKNCPNKTRYLASDIENIVIQYLFRASYLNQNKKNTVTDFDLVASLEKDITEKQQRLNNLVSTYSGFDPDSAKARAYAINIDKLSDEIDALSVTIKSEREKKIIIKKIEKVQSTVRDLASAWPHMTDDEKRTVCREVIESVEVTHTDNKPSIKINFQFADHLNT